MAVDFDRMLNAAVVHVFGEDVPAVYTPPGQPPLPLAGIFTRDHVTVVLDGDGAPVSARQTMFFARRTAFPAGTIPLQGDHIEVAGGAYRVADVRPDAIGGLELVLQARDERDDPEP